MHEMQRMPSLPFCNIRQRGRESRSIQKTTDAKIGKHAKECREQQNSKMQTLQRMQKTQK